MSDRKRKHSQHAQNFDSQLHHPAKRQHFLANNQHTALQPQVLHCGHSPFTGKRLWLESEFMSDSTSLQAITNNEAAATGSANAVQISAPAPLHLSSSNSFTSDYASPQPMQSRRQWSGSFGNSSSPSAMQHSSAMEEDEQSATPSTQASQRPLSQGMLSHSSSAPDLRLMLMANLPEHQHMFLPNAGSYAGALVPYKGPQQVVAEAAQHQQREQLLAQLKAQLWKARTELRSGDHGHDSAQNTMHLGPSHQQAAARDVTCPAHQLELEVSGADSEQANADACMLDAS